MEKLTLKQLKQCSKEILVSLLDKNQDLACNIDYVLNPLESEIIHKNITLIESIIIFKEY